MALTCFAVAFNSAVITADLAGVSETFGVGEEVSLLPITVFVIGFGVGPMAFAPLSEICGRRPIYASTLLVAVVFIIPCAVAENIGTLIVCRLIDGIAFAAPMTLVGGTLADLWRNEERGVPMACFSAAPFIGPAIGPLVGGFTGDALGWRWLYWLQLILSGFCYVLITFTVPETYAPTILARRAKKSRKQTGDSKFVTEMDLDKRPLGERLRVFLVRPFQLLFMEPIVLFISIYMSVLYSLLYMFFIAYPVVYQEGKGWTASSTGLMFIPLAVGVIMSAMCSPFVNRHYLQMVAKHEGKPPAEARLVPMMWSCWFIPVGLLLVVDVIQSVFLPVLTCLTVPTPGHRIPPSTGPDPALQDGRSASDSSSSTTARTTTSLTRISIKPPRRWPPRLSYVPSAVPGQSCLHCRCTARSTISGQAHCWVSLRWPVARYHTCSTTRAQRSARGLITPSQAMRRRGSDEGQRES